MNTSKQRRRQFAICNLQCSICDAPSRRAYTLVEVLLVLALLVIISGVAWVAVKGPMAHYRLKSAADDVRSQWCTARDDAMKSGHTYAFRYMVNGDRYHLGPQDKATKSDSSASEDDAVDDEPLPPPVDKTLPTGVRFVSDGESQAASGDAPKTAHASGGEWSDPIYFYADGSTSDARLLLAVDRRAVVRLLLRGVTGTVTVDDAATLTQ